MSKTFKRFLHYIYHFVAKPWYPLLVGLLAFTDLFILVIPTDGLTISAVLVKPKRWFFIALAVAIGSTLGGALLAYLLHADPDLIKSMLPNVFHSAMWVKTESYIQNYGLWAVFLIAASPLALQPIVVLGSLAELPLGPFIWCFFGGRILKFLFLAYIASHAPHLMSRLWGVRKEMEEIAEIKD